jgi:TRAP-type mannitol/chloroaromatic compound transport system permease large subunit
MSAEERLASRAQRFRLLRAGILPFFIFAAMMGPFLYGWASLVESSVIGAAIATLVAVVRGRMTKQVFDTCMVQTLGVSCMFMWIILAALAFGAVFDGLGAVKALEDLFLQDLGFSPWTILVLMQVSFLIMGMFLDDTAMLVIVAPIYVGLAKALGFDLIWYGILYTITCQIAYLTPPFGYNLFLMRAMAPADFTLPMIYRSVFPFVMVMIFTLIVLMIFPEIALWLPEKLI